MLFYISVVTVALFFGALAQLKDAPKEIPGTVGAVAHSRTCRALFLVSGTILILVAGLRYYVGTDYGAYYKQYGEYADSLWNRILTLDEPGYALISGISKWIINDGWFAIFLSSLVTIGAILATTYQHSEAIFLTLAFYIFMGCWHGSFNGTRQYLATAVFFCGLPFLMQRRFLPFCITVFLAFLCHKSAMVMVFLYFVVHRKICLRNLLITVFAVWLFSRAYEYLFTLSSFVLDDELSYNDFTTQSVNLIRIVVYSVPAVCFWAFFSRRELLEVISSADLYVHTAEIEIEAIASI